MRREAQPLSDYLDFDADLDQAPPERVAPGKRNTAHRAYAGIPATAPAGGAPFDFAAALDAITGRDAAPATGGAPLPADLRTRLEATAGVDLGSVRIDTSGDADGSARALGALAYTTGQDIHFAAGEYDPDSASGRHLIAHEVAHTIQQRGAAAPAAQAKLEVSQVGDAHEREADAFADAAAAGGFMTISPSPTAATTIQRREGREPIEWATDPDPLDASKYDPKYEGADHPACTPSQNDKLVRLRSEATAALLAWTEAGKDAIAAYHANIAYNWAEYLKLTSDNPGVSAGNVSSGLIRDLLQNAFSNAANDHALPAAGRRLSRSIASASAGAGRGAAGKVAAGASGAAVGSVGGPAGVAIGFVIGVLADTAANIIFDWIAGGSDQEKQQQAVYRKGRADGALDMGTMWQEKMAALEPARKAAGAYLAAQVRRHRRLIQGSCDAQEIAGLIAGAAGLARQARSSAPALKNLSFAYRLLAVWTREHAGGARRAGGDVNEDQWNRATSLLGVMDGQHFFPGRVMNEPALFIDQTARDWAQLGLSPDAVRDALISEAQVKPVHRSPEHAPGKAADLAQRFSRREFVWSQVPIRPFTRDLPGTAFPIGGQIAVQHAACSLVLEAVDGCCVVNAWRWTIRTADQTLDLERTPDKAGWQSIGFPRPEQKRLQFERQEIVEHGVGALASRGLTVVEGEVSWLQSKFGKDVFKARIASGDGANLPVRVLRVVEPLPSYDQAPSGSVAPSSDRHDGQLVDGVPEGRRLPRLDEVLGHFRGVEQIQRDPYLLVRGGDTMLVLEYYYYTGHR